MRKILTFTMPDDENDFTAANNGMDYFLALSDLDTALRNRVKYRTEDESPEATEAYEEIRQLLRDLLTERGVSLEDIL